MRSLVLGGPCVCPCLSSSLSTHHASLALADADPAAGWRLVDHDMHGEAVAQVVDMRDDEDQVELVLNGVDRLDETGAAGFVLRAEALVDEQRA